MSDRSDLKVQTSGCGGCVLLVMIVNVTIGAVTFSYCVDQIFGRTVPIGWAIVGGFFCGELTLPLALILGILKAAIGIHGPWVTS